MPSRRESCCSVRPVASSLTFFAILKVNEHVQQRYLAHMVPGRLLQTGAAQLAHEGPKSQTALASSASGAALSIADFPELPQDLDLMSNLDGDLFGEAPHTTSLGKP